MTKANMELPTGTKITIEGTPEEVAKAIRLMDGTSKLMERKEDVSNAKEKIASKKGNIESVTSKKLNENIISFAKYNGLDEDQLRTNFEFQTDGVTMCMPLKEKTRKILQIKTLLLIGVLLKKIYGVNNFSAKDILSSNKINTERLDHLNSNKDYQRFFSKNKPKSAMELNFAGEKKAIVAIKQYLSEGTFEL